MGTEENIEVNRICLTCKWRSDSHTSVCVNDCSDHLADFVMADETCEMWEKKNETPQTRQSV